MGTNRFPLQSSSLFSKENLNSCKEAVEEFENELARKQERKLSVGAPYFHLKSLYSR